MYKCGWSHCSYEGYYISDGQEKTRVGKRWYHKECAEERSCINDIITIFTEQVNANIEIPALRRVVNDIVFNDENPRPAQYVLFALNYAIEHPVMKLTYPQGLYRVCNSLDVLDAWKHRDDKKFVKTINSATFIAEDIKGTPTKQKQNNSGFSRILGRK